MTSDFLVVGSHNYYIRLKKIKKLFSILIYVLYQPDINKL
jgi:hypothetical protein